MLRNAKYRTFLAIILIIYSLALLHDRFHFDQYARNFLEKSLNAQSLFAKKCDKVNKVVFLKTHKCASSSLQNIFLRFGEKHNLNFALPRGGGHQFYGSNWHLIGEEYPNMTYHIFCLHSRFRYSEISRWMGDTSQTVYITMIRDPVDIFVSAWDYYKLDGNYKMTLHQFASATENVTRRRKNQALGPNQLLWDLGVDDIYNDEAVTEKIKEMEDKFHLVMIMENFEESLILMKQRLCWDNEDITNLKLNARRKSVVK